MLRIKQISKIHTYIRTSIKILVFWVEQKVDYIRREICLEHSCMFS